MNIMSTGSPTTVSYENHSEPFIKQTCDKDITISSKYVFPLFTYYELLFNDTLLI